MRSKQVSQSDLQKKLFKVKNWSLLKSNILRFLLQVLEKKQERENNMNAIIIITGNIGFHSINMEKYSVLTKVLHCYYNRFFPHVFEIAKFDISSYSLFEIPHQHYFVCFSEIALANWLYI